MNGRDFTVVARIRINKLTEMGEIQCRVYEGKKKILQKTAFTYKETFPEWRSLPRVEYYKKQMEREKCEWEH